MFVEIHMLQNFAPSNLNRDDTNNPKDCEFGGVRRARISSQCIKRSIRMSPDFEKYSGVETGTRSRWIARLVKQRLQEKGKDEEIAEFMGLAYAEAYAGKMDSKVPERSSVLLYMSPEEIERVVTALLENWEDLVEEAEKGKLDQAPKISEIIKDKIKEAKDRTSAPDIALFGRMLASKPELNLDAACQVAHAISTHRVMMEMDFFTALDDLQTDEEAGAGMMGFTGFNSATFYRYAAIDWEQLLKNLGHDQELARKTVEAFLRASVSAVPTGKQNSFAAQNPPSFMMGVIQKDGACWSLANAFEKPVRSKTNSGLIEPSVQALDQYWGQLTKIYGQEGIQNAAVLMLDNEIELENLSDHQKENLDQWVDELVSSLD
jgi:CRISPR system Cascade subunit CasC